MCSSDLTDPNGVAMHYGYDVNGDLTSFTDRATKVTTFDYAAGHYLQDIFDPLGRRPIRNDYDASGRLLFERRIQGREIDSFVSRLPSLWPKRLAASGEIPFVTPTIRTAAVDSSGHLWVSFAEPVTYEFDADGDKIRVVNFRAAGPVSPNHISFDERGRMLVTPGLYIFDLRRP